MDKSKALERLNALESEAKELRKIIEAPEAASSLLTKPVPLSSQAYYWSLTHDAYDGTVSFQTSSRKAVVATEYSGGNIFQSQELTEAYAEAFDTMLLLRHQPGTVTATWNLTQWVIQPSDDHMLTLEVDDWIGLASKSGFISPCFATESDALRAIKTVGEERILRMFKTLHHIS